MDGIGLIATTLRPYQVSAIQKLRQSLAAGRKRPVLQAPTGAGKTAVAAAIIRMARDKQKRVAFLVPALSLIDQTVQAFWREGIHEVGVIQADHHLTDWLKPIQICSVQTLQNRGYPQVDLVIIDEAHRRAEFVLKWMADPDWQKVPFIGLSATPWARGMGRHFDDLIVVATTQQLIDEGYLSRFRVFAPSHPDLSKVKIVAGDYHEGQLSDVMSEQTLVGDVVETWKRLGEDRPTICFAVDCAHARALQDQFIAAGVKCGYMDASTTTPEREIIRQHFHDGRLKVVANVGVLIQGVDWDVRCLILARPTRSEMFHVQTIGRALRLAPGKADAILLDHADNHSRLGFVTDIHHEKLDDGSEGAPKKRSAPTPKECPKCHFLRPAKVSKCPNCGHEVRGEKQSAIEYEAGELAEISRGKKAASKTIILRDKEIPLGRFFGQLKAYAVAHGYKQGWAANQFKTVVGAWPNAYGDAPLITPSVEVLGWIKSRQIAWAKRKGKGDAHPNP
jgi:superfamily II DNA or RNA helicase